MVPEHRGQGWGEYLLSVVTRTPDFRYLKGLQVPEG